jgi:hypothetical protein
MPAIPQPGVTVIQEIATTSPTVASSALPACIIGPAFQVVETQVDGLLSADALATTYSQYALSLSQSSFPDPRSNIAELDVQEDTVEASLYYGGALIPLPRGDGNPYGSSFLAGSNVASRATVVTTVGTVAAAVADGDSLVLAFDRTSPADTSRDVTVTIAAAAAVATQAEIVAAINAAVGATVALVAPAPAAALEIMIRSNTWGASSSVDVRAAGSASTKLFGDALSRRAVGSGYRAQDDLDGDLTSPWIEYFRGEAFINGVGNLWGGAGIGIGLWTEAGAFSAAYATAVSFAGGGATIPLQAASASRAGDALVSSGTDMGWEVVEVQVSRFRMAQLDSALSTFDTEGNATTRVYIDKEVNALTHSVPFAPRNVWFEAQGLQWGSVTPPPVAAVLTGNIAATAAQVAEIQDEFTTANYPLNLLGRTLVFQRTVAGVAQTQETYTFAAAGSAAIANSAALDTQLTALALVGITHATPYDDAVDTHVHFSSAASGSGETLTLLATGTANADLGFSAAVATTHTGKDQEYTTQAVVTGGVYADPATQTLTMEVIDSRGTHNLSLVLGAGPFASAAACAAELETKLNQIAFDGDIRVVTFSDVGGVVVCTSVESGAAVSIEFTDADASTTLGLAAGPTLGSDDLTGTTLQYSLDGGDEFTATFGSDSLDDAVATVNLLHGGAVIASISTTFLRLTSPLGGVASSVTVNAASTADTVLGFTGGNVSASGTGRPNPDCYLDLSGNLVLGAEILRNGLTGAPFVPASASLYVAYEALRLDVSSASLAVEKLLTLDDQTALEAVGQPLDERNPLFLGMYLAMLNSPTTSVTGIGVDEVSAAQPEGTLDGYARAFDYLEAKDVYGMAPLTENDQVHLLLDGHVTAMSAADQRGERIGLIAPEAPTRAFPTSVASGVGDSTASPNELTIDENPTGTLVANGINPAAIDADDGVYVEVTVGTGDFRRYNVSLVNGTLLQLRTTFVSPDNDDGFYSTTTLSVVLTNVAYALKIRGASLVIAGSTLPDLTARAAAVAAGATDYLNRRMFYLFPDSVTVELDNGTSIVPAYYGAAAVAGQIGHQPPAQPLTNFPITGLSAVQGSHDTYKKSLLDTIAGGGVYILFQQSAGGAVMCRHQLSTDVTSVERRELSITRAVDFVAKFLRSALRNLIGKFNITPQFLNNLATVIQGQLAFLGPDGLSVIAAAELNNVLQDEDNPDTILVDVTLTVLYPANQIRVTLVV